MSDPTAPYAADVGKVWERLLKLGDSSTPPSWLLAEHESVGAQLSSKEWVQSDRLLVLRLLGTALLSSETAPRLLRASCIQPGLAPALVLLLSQDPPALPKDGSFSGLSASDRRVALTTIALSLILPRVPTLVSRVPAFFARHGSPTAIAVSTVSVPLLRAMYRLLTFSSSSFSVSYSSDKLFPFEPSSLRPLLSLAGEVRAIALNMMHYYYGTTSPQFDEQSHGFPVSLEDYHVAKWNAQLEGLVVVDEEEESEEQEQSEMMDIDASLSDDDLLRKKSSPTSSTPGKLFTATDAAPLGLIAVGSILLSAAPIQRDENTQSENGTMSLDDGQRPDYLVSTPRLLRSLSSLASAVSSSCSILIQGPTGSGKTSLVSSLAQTTGSTLQKIFLSAQSDAKLLLGSYVCTQTPGHFKWIPGILTLCVKNGNWVILEDVDRASAEVLSILFPLLHTRSLHLPGRNETITAHPNFRLFATRTVNDVSAPLPLGLDSAFVFLSVEVPPADEVSMIISSKYPILPPVVRNLALQSYSTLVYEPIQRKIAKDAPVRSKNANTVQEDTPNETSSNEHSTDDGSLKVVNLLSRQPALRDVLRWCKRASTTLHRANISQLLVISQALKETLFLDALDCYAMALPDGPERAPITKSLERIFSIDASRSQYLLHSREPPVQPQSDMIAIGRVQIAPKEGVHMPRGAEWARTRHSAQLLERVAAAVTANESVLLVGETGVGKTHSVQHLAHLLHQPLVVLNLNQQSDASDLLGGPRPIPMQHLYLPVLKTFETLFAKTFSKTSNASFLTRLKDMYSARQFASVLQIIAQTIGRAQVTLNKDVHKPHDESSADQESAGDSNGTARNSNKKSSRSQKSKSAADSSQPEESRPVKRARAAKPALLNEWVRLATRVQTLQSDLAASPSRASAPMTFAYVEGALVTAIQQGQWVLLDEVNLASDETLECLLSLLEGGSITLLERGDTSPIPRHPNFRLFACMNPPTDVGKRQLVPGVRQRFSEIYVDDFSNVEDLRAFVVTYLDGAPPAMVNKITDFYLAVRAAASQHLTDGTQAAPRYSLRTLARALRVARHMQTRWGLPRALREGMTMAFLAQLDNASIRWMESALATHFGSSPAIEGDIVPHIEGTTVKIGPYELPRGSLAPVTDSSYILTPSVRARLLRLSLLVAAGPLPVLLQGPTSAGKTSLVRHLARLCGRHCVRINNHEHTDLQEYLGQYVPDASGALVFREGPLVRAVREGHWVVLDELNLAPSDVLEALNRLLDDNRELFLPETQETIKAHPAFVLFATQNPPGLYGGRKPLSRAFRNRFVELHFDDLPEEELEIILTQRAHVPPAWARIMISVVQDLQRDRQASGVFAGKHVLTLRDLFRWAERRPGTLEELAQHGYMLLAERLRVPEERATVIAALEKHCRVKLDMPAFYASTAAALQSRAPAAASRVVWTAPMQRVLVLAHEALRRAEPLLLVGETGAGKTTACELLASLYGSKLLSLNCHQHTETADLLGSLRPVRGREDIRSRLAAGLTLRCEAAHLALTGHADSAILNDLVNGTIPEKMSALTTCARLAANPGIPPASAHRVRAAASGLTRAQREWARVQAMFEWQDGPLVAAMTAGDHLLLDEISLADDAVLERLNSVLEPSRTLLLAEKGTVEGRVPELSAHADFRLVATMNPGGDYGKKELSPALRNRFTEIFATTHDSDVDLRAILESRLPADWTRPCQVVDAILSFRSWAATQSLHLGLRDVLAWVQFVAHSASSLGLRAAYQHGASLVLLDALPLLCPDPETVSAAARKILEAQATDLPGPLPAGPPSAVLMSANELTAGEFSVPRRGGRDSDYSLQAPGTVRNVERLLRALKLPRALLLEGPPGVGKTSLVLALAAALGQPIVRINLSDQTDLLDLLGGDLPSDAGTSDGSKQDGGGARFVWRDGVLLAALRRGHWVLLDELNLAPQPVLEGLNALLDHRAAVYVPELRRTFHPPASFRIFACQNPTAGGGGRKGLPQSFLNRFTKVHVGDLTPADLEFIATSLFPNVSSVPQMVTFVSRLAKEVASGSLGLEGSPWEFNLRDILRWCELVTAPLAPTDRSPPLSAAAAATPLFEHRFRTATDRVTVRALLESVLGPQETRATALDSGAALVAPHAIQIGSVVLSRAASSPVPFTLLPHQLPILHSLAMAVAQSWPALLVGPSGSGKTALVQGLASALGRHIVVVHAHAGMDAAELLGGYEQVDVVRDRGALTSALRAAAASALQRTERALDNSYRNLETFWLTLDERIRACPGAWTEDMYSLVEETLTLLSSAGIDVATLHSLLAALRRAENRNAAGEFEWVDGPLVGALRAGSWLMLEHASVCPPAILDRLNPLLERGGVLSLTERGAAAPETAGSEMDTSSEVLGDTWTIAAHPDFRLFLTVDPTHGDVSRAMRNRCLELALLPDGNPATPDLDGEMEPSSSVSRIDAVLDPGAAIRALVAAPMDPSAASLVQSITNPIVLVEVAQVAAPSLPLHLIHRLVRTHSLLQRVGPGAGLRELLRVTRLSVAASSARTVSSLLPLAYRSFTASQLAEAWAATRNHTTPMLELPAITVCDSDVLSSFIRSYRAAAAFLQVYPESTNIIANLLVRRTLPHAINIVRTLLSRLGLPPATLNASQLPSALLPLASLPNGVRGDLLPADWRLNSVAYEQLLAASASLAPSVSGALLSALAAAAALDIFPALTEEVSALSAPLASPSNAWEQALAHARGLVLAAPSPLLMAVPVASTIVDTVRTLSQALPTFVPSQWPHALAAVRTLLFALAAWRTVLASARDASPDTLSSVHWRWLRSCLRAVVLPAASVWLAVPPSPALVETSARVAELISRVDAQFESQCGQHAKYTLWRRTSEHVPQIDLSSLQLQDCAPSDRSLQVSALATLLSLPNGSSAVGTVRDQLQSLSITAQTNRQEVARAAMTGVWAAILAETNEAESADTGSALAYAATYTNLPAITLARWQQLLWLRDGIDRSFEPYLLDALGRALLLERWNPEVLPDALKLPPGPPHDARALWFGLWEGLHTHTAPVAAAHAHRWLSWLPYSGSAHALLDEQLSTPPPPLAELDVKREWNLLLARLRFTALVHHDAAGAAIALACTAIREALANGGKPKLQNALDDLEAALERPSDRHWLAAAALFRPWLQRLLSVSNLNCSLPFCPSLALNLAPSEVAEAILVHGQVRVALSAPTQAIPPTAHALLRTRLLRQHANKLSVELAAATMLRAGDIYSPVAVSAPELAHLHTHLSASLVSLQDTLRRTGLNESAAETMELAPASFTTLYEHSRNLRSTILSTERVSSLIGAIREIGVRGWQSVMAQESHWQRAVVQRLPLFAPKDGGDAAESTLRELLVGGIAEIRTGVRLLLWDRLHAMPVALFDPTPDPAADFSLSLSAARNTIGVLANALLTQNLTDLETLLDEQPIVPVLEAWSTLHNVLGRPLATPPPHIVLTRLLLTILTLIRETVLAKGEISAPTLAAVQRVCALFSAAHERITKAEAEKAAQTSTIRFRAVETHIETDEEREERLYRERFPDWRAQWERLAERAERRSAGEVDDDDDDDDSESEDLAQSFDQILGTAALAEADQELLCTIHADIFAPWTPANRLDILAPERVSASVERTFDTAALLMRHALYDVPSHIDGAGVELHMFILRRMQERLTPRPLGPTPETSFYSRSDPAEAALLREPLLKLAARVSELLEAVGDNAVLQLITLLIQRLLAAPLQQPLVRHVAGVEFVLERLQLWQSTAPRQYSLHEEERALLSLVSRWRRQELAYWPHLLSECRERSRRGVLRWWYFLQAAIATDPASITSDLTSEWNARLALVRVHAAQAERTGLSTAIAMKNILRYYDQYTPAVTRLDDTLRAPLEKEMKDKLTLGRWEDSSYYRMKETAEKSHRQLMKVSRSYEKLLQQSAAEAWTGASFVMDKMAAPAPPSAPVLAAVPDDFPQRTRKAVRVASRILSWLATPDSEMAALAREITETVGQLRTMTEPKHKAVKRRVLGGYMKKFQQMGLTWHTRAREEDQKEFSLLMQRSPLPEHPALAAADKAYYVHVSALLALRTAASAVLKDLTRREVDIILGLHEHLLALTLQQREALTKAVASAERQQAATAALAGHRSCAQQVRAAASSLALQLRRAVALLPPATAASSQLAVVSANADRVLALADEVNASTLRLSNRVLPILAEGAMGMEANLVHQAQQLASAVLTIAPKSRALREAAETLRAAATEFPAEPETSEELQASAQECLLLQLQGYAALQAEAAANSSTDAVPASKLDISDDANSDNQAANDEDSDSALHIIREHQRIMALLAAVSSDSAPLEAVHCGSPGLRSLAATASTVQQGALAAAAHRHTALLRLHNVCLHTTVALFRDGFCTLPPADDDAESGDEELMDNEMAGLGEGDGARDVTKEMDDEEQLLGEKPQQQQPPPQQPPPREEDGMEIEADFEGTMEDAPPPDKDDEDENDDEEDEPEPDKAMGALEGGRETIDEKFWSESEEPEELEDDGRVGEKAQEQAAGHDSEWAANENDTKEIDPKRDRKTGEPPQNQPPEANPDDGEGEEAGEEQNEAGDEGEGEEADDERNSAYPDPQENNPRPKEEEEALEIPEDLTLDKNERGDAGDDGDGMDLEDDSKDDASGGEEDEDELKTPFPKDQPNPEQPEEAQEDKNEAEQEGDAAPDAQDAAKEEPQDGDDGEDGTGNQGAEPMDLDEEEEEEKSTNEDFASTFAPPEAEKAMGVAGEGTAPLDTVDDSARASAQQDAKEDTGMDGAQSGEGTVTAPASSSGPPPDTTRDAPNPYRSLGDAEKHWERLRMVPRPEQDPAPESADPAESQQPELPEPQPDASEGVFEAVGANEAADAQTLGAATDEQHQALPPQQEQEKPKEEEASEQSHEDAVAASKDREQLSARRDTPPEAGTAPPRASVGNDAPDAMDADPEDPEMEKKEFVKASGNGSGAAEPVDEESDDMMDIDSLDIVEVTSERMSAPDIAAIRAWQALKAATGGPAAALAEQLRLILEPTKAAALRGDYRTGKRLNLRKVIGYIASDYRHDKIWLRRSLPSRREYQLLLGVDDTASVVRQGVADRVREALATITLALQRTEAGEVALTKFGSETSVLHPFGVPFDDTAAAAAFNQLTFEQQSTNMVRFLQHAVSMLEAARKASLSHDSSLLQLLLVVSDGRFGSDRSAVRRWLRRAAASGILCVLVILDASTQADSILSVRSVAVSAGKPRLVAYMDEFPFDYYIVAHDTQSLPTTLAAALRQWVELARH